jgi:hypothetical protein
MSPRAAAQFLIGLLVLGLVLYCVWLLIGMFPIPAPFGTILLIIFFLIALGFLLNWTGLWPTRGP